MKNFKEYLIESKMLASYSGPYDNYLKIGHDTQSDGKHPNELWRAEGKKIKYMDVTDNRDTHSKKFGAVGGRSYNQGRIDHSRKIISFSPKLDEDMTTILSIALDLRNKYRDYQIIIFIRGDHAPKILKENILKEDISFLNEKTSFWAPPKQYGTHATYVSIGHSGYEKINLDNVVLWMADGKRIKYKSPKEHDDRHDQIFNFRSPLAYGRIVHSEKLISFEYNHSFDVNGPEIYSVAYDLQKKYPNYDIIRKIGNHWSKFIG